MKKNIIKLNCYVIRGFVTALIVAVSLVSLSGCGLTGADLSPFQRDPYHQQHDDYRNRNHRGHQYQDPFADQGTNDYYSVSRIIQNGDLSGIEKFLAEGGDANLSNGFSSLLEMAVKENAIEIAQALLKAGADVNDKSTLRDPPLWAALSNKGALDNFKMARLLLSHGAKPDLTKTSDESDSRFCDIIRGFSSLNTAAADKAVLLLIEFNANVNAKCATHRGNLMFTLETSLWEAAKTLAEKNYVLRDDVGYPSGEENVLSEKLFSSTSAASTHTLSVVQNYFKRLPPKHYGWAGKILHRAVADGRDDIAAIFSALKSHSNIINYKDSTYRETPYAQLHIRRSALGGDKFRKIEAIMKSLNASLGTYKVTVDVSRVKGSIQSDDASDVDAFIKENGGNIDLTTEISGVKYSLLSLAVKSNAMKVIKQLLDSGAKVDGSNDEKESPLHYAFTSLHRANNFAAAKLLLQFGARPDSSTSGREEDSKFCGLLFGKETVGTHEANEEALLVLINGKANTKALCDSNKTNLISAIERTYWKVAKALADQKDYTESLKKAEFESIKSEIFKKPAASAKPYVQIMTSIFNHMPTDLRYLAGETLRDAIDKNRIDVVQAYTAFRGSEDVIEYREGNTLTPYARLLAKQNTLSKTDYQNLESLLKGFGASLAKAKASSAPKDMLPWQYPAPTSWDDSKDPAIANSQSKKPYKNSVWSKALVDAAIKRGKFDVSVTDTICKDFLVKAFPSKLAALGSVFPEQACSEQRGIHNLSIDEEAHCKELMGRRSLLISKCKDVGWDSSKTDKGSFNYRKPNDWDKSNLDPAIPENEGGRPIGSTSYIRINAWLNNQVAEAISSGDIEEKTRKVVCPIIGKGSLIKGLISKGKAKIALNDAKKECERLTVQGERNYCIELIGRRLTLVGACSDRDFEISKVPTSTPKTPSTPQASLPITKPSEWDTKIDPAIYTPNTNVADAWRNVWKDPALQNHDWLNDGAPEANATICNKIKAAYGSDKSSYTRNALFKHKINTDQGCNPNNFPSSTYDDNAGEYCKLVMNLRSQFLSQCY